MNTYRIRLGLSTKALTARLKKLALSPVFGAGVLITALIAGETGADLFALYACAFISISSFLCYFVLLRFYLVLRPYQLVLLFSLHLINVTLWVFLVMQFVITVFFPESSYATQFIWLVFGVATIDVIQHFLFKVFGSRNNLLLVQLNYRIRDSLGGGLGQLIHRRLTGAGRHRKVNTMLNKR